jgi:hypothetical protein
VLRAPTAVHVCEILINGRVPNGATVDAKMARARSCYRRFYASAQDANFAAYAKMPRSRRRLLPGRLNRTGWSRDAPVGEGLDAEQVGEVAEVAAQDRGLLALAW